MSNERFKGSENQPALADTIETFYGILQTLADKPPKNTNRNKTEKRQSVLGMRSFNAMSFTGDRFVTYVLDQTEDLPRRIMDIYFSSINLDGTRAMLRITEPFETTPSLSIETTYKIGDDRVFKHIQARGTIPEAEEENLLDEIERQDAEEKKFAGAIIMSEGEVVELSTQLRSLLAE